MKLEITLNRSAKNRKVRKLSFDKFFHLKKKSVALHDQLVRGELLQSVGLKINVSLLALRTSDLADLRDYMLLD